VTRRVGAGLPAPLYQPLSSDDPAGYEGLTLLLLSVGEDGWPHQAMLSVGEVVALDRRRMRLALWPQSTTTRNLTGQGQAILTAVLDEVGYVARLRVSESGELETPRAGTLARFDARVEDVKEDVVPYAVLESGIRFRLTEREDVLARWGEVRAALRGG
jgi:hypothetical protein